MLRQKLASKLATKKLGMATLSLALNKYTNHYVTVNKNYYVFYLTIQ